MARESLKACQVGINKAKLALTSKGWTQEELAEKLQTTRQPVANFFAGKGVDRKNLVKICELLELDWQEIVGINNAFSSISPLGKANVTINVVQELREKVEPYIKERCGTMRVLDMTQPIELNDIYTDVNILETITGRLRLNLDELLKKFKTSANEVERIGIGQIIEKRVSGLEVVKCNSRLMILGKPGAGKTTFLKYLAIECISGNFQEGQVPVFITLKEFAETDEQPSLYNFIVQKIVGFNQITNAQVLNLLSLGKFLILLDGLDEVREKQHWQIVNQIRLFTEQYKNKYVITCRIAAREYTFEKFTEVEIADFNDEQIRKFINKWFQQKNDLDSYQRFLQQLELNEPIRELANNPLLLTLLCLEFSDSGDFPSDRAELYNRAIHTLLRKWDNKRGIVRDEVYKKLSIRNKENLLSQISLITFQRNEYFFKQRDLERYIAEYIRNLPEAKIDPGALQVDSEVVLKSIEAQHGLIVERARGIYSFSHLTFQEYFTAKEIVYSSDIENAFQNLVSHIIEKRWREVFLLTVGMLKNADNLLQLMKQRIDELLEKEEKLQEFLTWVKQKSESVEAYCKAAAVRSLYSHLAFAQNLNEDLARSLDRNFNQDLDEVLARHLNEDFALTQVQAQTQALTQAQARDLFRPQARDLNLIRTQAQDLARTLVQAIFVSNQYRNSQLEQALQHLEEQLPNVADDWEKYEQWWQKNGQTWVEKLRGIMIEYRNIGHNWQFNNAQRELWQYYYDANKLLADCLNSDCYVNREVRQKIEDTLLLPLT
ncbi:NACHT domain-containing NTPase [Nostoc sp.]|uniref:NACHT domain-containing NTPase n=1 Tax=Nostoc sp. TaxID=1180 RepID=UPI002FFA63BF